MDQPNNPRGAHGPPAGGQTNAADAVVGGMLGWLFIMVGSAAVAAAALIPGYLDTLGVQQARETESIKAAMLADERQRYENFYNALADDDPVLIERLAMTELRLKAVGTDLAEQGASDPVALVASASPLAIENALAVRPMMRSIENELSRPDLKQQAVVDVQLQRPRETRLILAATGEHRPWLAGIGALLLIMGLWPKRASA